MLSKLPTVKAVIVMCGKDKMPPFDKPNVVCYEDLIRCEKGVVIVMCGKDKMMCGKGKMPPFDKPNVVCYEELRRCGCKSDVISSIYMYILTCV